MFSSLQFRDFRLLWFANLAATFAMQMQMVARGWLIYDMTSSPMALTWVMLSFLGPSLVFSLAGGVIADRFRKRSIMVSAQVLNTLATAILAWIIYAGEASFWYFIGFGLFNGTVLAFSMPARASVTPEIVGRKHIVNAMALQSATFNLARILGPALAGVIIALVSGGEISGGEPSGEVFSETGISAATATSAQGVGIVFFIIALQYAFSAVCTGLLHYQGNPDSRDTSAITDIIEGFHYIRGQPVILGLLVMSFVPMTFGLAVSFLLPAYNADVIKGGPDELGLMLTSTGIGALIGSIALARAGDIGRKGKIMFAAGFLWALFIICFALSNSFAVAMFFIACTGLFGSLVGALNMSIVQIILPNAIRGRVMSIMMMAMGFMPVAIVPISLIAENVGIEVALLISGGLLAVSLLVIWWWIPQLVQINRGQDDASFTATTDASPDEMARNDRPKAKQRLH